VVVAHSRTSDTDLLVSKPLLADMRERRVSRAVASIVVVRPCDATAQERSRTGREAVARLERLRRNSMKSLEGWLRLIAAAHLDEARLEVVRLGRWRECWVMA
jgi:hypothetical protein